MATNLAQLVPDAPDLRQAVAATVRALTLTPADTGAVRLALDYAAAIDDADEQADALAALGPKLLATLEALGATPAARAKAKPTTGGKPESQLGKLRAARRSR